MQIDPTTNDPGQNELADRIIQERASLKHIRILLNGMNWVQKIAVAQMACNLIGKAEPVEHIRLEPVKEIFDYQLQAAVQLIGSLPPDTLAEIAIEILEEPRDSNE